MQDGPSARGDFHVSGARVGHIISGPCDLQGLGGVVVMVVVMVVMIAGPWAAHGVVVIAGVLVVMVVVIAVDRSCCACGDETRHVTCYRSLLLESRW